MFCERLFCSLDGNGYIPRLFAIVVLFVHRDPRPRPPDEVLSRRDLAELQHRLSMMSVTAVQDFYRSAHMVCRIGPAQRATFEREGGGLPGGAVELELWAPPDDGSALG